MVDPNQPAGRVLKSSNIEAFVTRLRLRVTGERENPMFFTVILDITISTFSSPGG
jgi:hypothetical protein